MTIVNELRHTHALHILLDVAQLKRTTYYYHVNGNDKDRNNASVIEQIKSLFTTHYQRYGYRRITLELRKKGYCINHKKVKRLMTKLGLFAVNTRVKYKSYTGETSRICDNKLLDEVVTSNKGTQLKRNFTTTRCNEKWTTDVTEFKHADGKLYLSPIQDMYTGEIISYNLAPSANFKQTKDMLDKAFAQYNDLDGLILHSDQGWQYQMQEYQSMLKERNIIQSMSRKGNCLDNAVMESFFGIMKQEMFYGYEKTFKTIEQLKQAIEEYIVYYNTQRIREKLGGLTPVEYKKSIHRHSFVI